MSAPKPASRVLERLRIGPVVDGVEMLVQLAMQIFERWAGITPEEAVFQTAVSEALGE